MIAYISIGNSDDKLTQARWAEFVEQVSDTLHDHTYTRHGEWFSVPSAPWQNACWCVELLPQDAERLKFALADDAKAFDQDSIHWLAGDGEFLTPQA